MDTPVRKLNGHKVNPANDTLNIEVVDQPGAGGANHAYLVTGFTKPFPGRDELPGCPEPNALVLFQNGPIAEAGVNGLTQEVLLAILIDRLESFQNGPYACHYNDIAMMKLEEAQMWLQKRTRDRMARGVEGTHKQ